MDWRTAAILLLTTTTSLLMALANSDHNDPIAGQHFIKTTTTAAPCPPPEDISIFDVPDAHVGILLAAYAEVIEQYCGYCEQCIRELRKVYLRHFDRWYPEPCWGYEMDCDISRHFRPMPICWSAAAADTTAAVDANPATAKQRAKEDAQRRDQERAKRFYQQADFGYIQMQRRQVQDLCMAYVQHEDAWMACSKNLQFCKGKWILIDLRELADRKTPVRYDMDVLKLGEISMWSWARGVF